MNAVDRFWDARCTQNWESLGAQLRAGVSISMVHEDAELSRDEYFTFLRVMHQDADTKITRIVGGRSMQFAVLAEIRRAKATFECAGFYALREGRIELIEELWLSRGTGRLFDLI